MRWLQSFEYAAVWTKPWRELETFRSQVKIFREFTFVRREQKTDKVPVNIVPPTDMVGRAFAFGLSLYRSNTKALVEKANQSRGQGVSGKLYKEALNAAHNNNEYTKAMEALINAHHEGIEYAKTCSHAYASPEAQIRYRELLDSSMRTLDEYIDQLPEDFYLNSNTVTTLNAFFNEVWSLLEADNPEQAWSEFNKKEIFKLIFSPFVSLTMPHFICMWHNLIGVFYFKDFRDDCMADEQDVPALALGHFRKVAELLEKHQLPEAKEFRRDTIEPLERMQAHVESLFQQVPRAQALHHAREYFWEFRERALQGESIAYRGSKRGKRISLPEWLASQYQDTLARRPHRDDMTPPASLTM